MYGFHEIHAREPAVRKMGLVRAWGRILTGPEALDLGLVAEILPPDGFLEGALERASTWAASVPAAMAPALQNVFRRGLGLPQQARMALERAAAQLYHGSFDRSGPANAGPC